MKYLLTLMFDGKNFHGSQKQPNQRTVRDEIEKAIFQITREKKAITSCSRTDSGVHANMFCCTFFSEKELDVFKFANSLNAVLPKDVAVRKAEKVSEDFHPQKSCVKKEYIYKIYNGARRNPFFEGYALHHSRPLDEKKLDEFAKAFVGTFDFSAFCSSGSSADSKERTIFECDVSRKEDMVIFRVVGNGFLYNMVRIMVGTLLDASDGKIDGTKIADIIKSKDRNLAGKTAKPDGLYLNKVFYGQRF